MILVIYAHPYPSYSRAGRALVDAISSMPDLEIRSLYDLYPDFDIDVAAEQRALTAAQLIVWLHPLYWYSTPGLLKHWFDKVLEHGWAYGTDGTALRGKHCLWVPTAGGEEANYAEGQIHQRPFERYIEPIERTARFCGIHWEPPLIVFGSQSIPDETLSRHAADLRGRLEAFAAAHAAATAETAWRAAG
jgi:glutathione-regulated potassium-efflux system ancillary protein KefF